MHFVLEISNLLLMGGLGWTGGSKLPETDLKRRHPLQAIGRILCSCNMVLHRRTQLYDDKVQTEYVCLQEIPFFGSHKQLSYRIMLTIHESCDADAGPLKGSSWRCSSALISLRTYFNSVRMGIRGENFLCFGEEGVLTVNDKQFDGWYNAGLRKDKT